MSRKKKSRSKQAKQLTADELARSAADQLEQAHFREAASRYKQALKKEARPEWLEGLARAYAGRAEHLASLGMIKEAIALWQNRADTCNKPLADPRYLQWLVVADRTRAIGQLYREDAAALAGAEGIAALQARLAAAALTGGGELVAELPAGDPVVRDFAHANSALLAYAEHDDQALERTLSGIAFRSPYRDFRQLMKALRRYEQEPEAAAELVARIPADTPFAGLLAPLRQAAQIRAGAPADALALAGLPDSQRAVLAALLGWHPEQEKLLKPLAGFGPQASRNQLFEFVLAHRATVGEDYARVAAFMLAGGDQRMCRRLAKVYGDMPNSEGLRLLALSCEKNGNVAGAVETWHGVLDALQEEADQGARDPLRQALIHRHIVDLLQPESAGLPLNSHAAEHLAASLELDSSDRASVLRLLDHYLHVGDLKSARRRVDRALTQFPDDTECLFRAAQIAVAGKAFKKAAHFADQILALDPIDTNARGLLVDAHIGHARKQIKARKPDAARREIKHAAGFARSPIDTARIALLEGLATFACDDANAAAARFEAGIRHVDDPLIGRFLLLLEAGRLSLDLTAVERAAALPAVKALGEQAHVLALIEALGTLRQDPLDKPAAEAALKQLAPAFNQVANVRLERGRAEQVCEVLLRYRQNTVLKRYARTALQHWPRDPLFTFYWVMGQKSDGFLDPTGRERALLEAAFQDARAAGDSRTAQRIGERLDAGMPRFSPHGMNAFDPFAGFEDDEDPPDWNLEPPGSVNLETFEAILKLLLSSDEQKRFDKAMRQGKPIPPDIDRKIERILKPEFGSPQPGKGPSRKAAHRSAGDDTQGDLF